MSAKDEATKPGTTPDRVRYTDREVAQILRRAVALQEKQGTGPGRGLSLDELKEVAREVGVDARFVVEAARMLTRGAAPSGNRLLGGPTRMQAMELVNLPYRAEQMAAVLEELRRVTGHLGRASQLADATEWHGKDSMGTISVSVSRAAGDTRVRVMGNRTEAAAVIYGVGGSIALIGAGMLGGALSPYGATVVTAGVAAAAAASLLALRAVWTRYTRRWDERIRSTVGTVVHVLRQTGGPEE